MNQLSSLFKNNPTILFLTLISVPIIFYSVTVLALEKKNLEVTTQNGYAQSITSMNDRVDDSSLTVKVIKSFKPKKVDIVGSAIYFRTGDPPSNQKWLVLQIEIKPYKKGKFTSSKEINIIDALKKMYPLQGISKVEKNPFYSFLDDIGKRDFTGRSSLGITLMDENNKIYLWLMKNDKGDIDFFCENTEPIELLLLFEVPVDGKNLQLQIDSLPLIKIPN